MAGTITVITGGMFSGKSEQLIRYVEQAITAGYATVIFYPHMANRQSERDIQRRIVNTSLSHVPVFAVDTQGLGFHDIVQQHQADVIAIDETQFFSRHIVDVVRAWRHQGRHVAIAGLDMDSNENPFGPMGDLLCLADNIMKLHAQCSLCHNPAMISYRLNDSREQVMVGERNYTALCLECYDQLSSHRSQGGQNDGAVREKTSNHSGLV